jgi:hypothetical protein
MSRLSWHRERRRSKSNLQPISDDNMSGDSRAGCRTWLSSDGDRETQLEARDPAAPRLIAGDEGQKPAHVADTNTPQLGRTAPAFRGQVIHQQSEPRPSCDFDEVPVGDVAPWQLIADRRLGLGEPSGAFDLVGVVLEEHRKHDPRRTSPVSEGRRTFLALPSRRHAAGTATRTPPRSTSTRTSQSGARGLTGTSGDLATGPPRWARLNQAGSATTRLRPT